MIASLAGREAVRAGYLVRTFDQSTQNRQNAQENKGTYTRVLSAVFLTADFHGMSYPASLRTCGRYEFLSEHLLDTHQDRHPKMLVLVNTQSFFLFSAGSFILSFPKLLRWRLFRPVYLLILFLKMKLSCFCKPHKKEPDKIQMIFTSILRQALVVMIAHTPIRSVRTFFLWKLTAMTDLQMGHLILMMPSTVSGSASNNLLFLQHGQATCTSCISFRLPQEASQKGMSNWPLVIVLFSSALFAVT